MLTVSVRYVRVSIFRGNGTVRVRESLREAIELSKRGRKSFLQAIQRGADCANGSELGLAESTETAVAEETQDNLAGR